MDDVAGEPGELIDRFIVIIGDDEWASFSLYIALALGGPQLMGTMPDTGREYPPGSVGAMRREGTSPMAGRDEYLGLIGNRLAEIVLTGVSEAFLIRGIRDEIRARLVTQADVATGDEKRAELRRTIDWIAGDPTEIAALRSSMAEKHSSEASLTDEQVVEKLREMAEWEHLQPIPVEDAVDRWAGLNRWDEKVSTSLSDEFIEAWVTAYLHRRRES